MAGTYLGKCLLFGLSICSKSWRGNVGEKNGGVGMNCKGGDRENSGGKQWEAKRAVKSLYPSAWWKPENLVKFTSYARIKRKHWISEYDTTENRGLLPTTSFDNARTICFKSVILRIMYYSYKCYSHRFKSFRIYNILQPQYHRWAPFRRFSTINGRYITRLSFKKYCNTIWKLTAR